jgi:phage-related protein
MAEAPTMEVRARLSADTAQFTRGFQQATKAAEDFSQTSNRLRGAMVGIGIASAAATTAIIAFGTKAFNAAARVDELDIAMNAVGKSTGLGYQAIRDSTLAIKANGIEMDIAQKAALKFAQNNIDLAKGSELARVAQDLAVISGMNSSDTFNMLTHAVITGRSEVLKSVGIQKSAGAMNEEYARSIGKTVQSLTAQEKQTAVLTGALKEGAKVAGTYEAAMTSPGKVLRSFARVQNEIAVAIGGVLLKGFGPLIFSAYNLVKATAKAAEGSKTVQAVFEALTMVLTKLTKPLIAIIDKFKDYIEGLDKVVDVQDGVIGLFDRTNISVKGLAEKFEFLLPAVAAVTAAFATFAGAQVFKMIPVLGTVLGGLAGPLGIVAVVMATLYLTSTQVKNAMNELFSALKPVAEAVKTVGGAFFVAASYGVSVFSFAISGLATVISSTTTFLRQNRIVLIALGATLGGVITAMVFFKVQTLLAAAATKYSIFITGMKAKILNAEAVAAARAGVAEARLAFAENTQALAAAKATAATRALAVQNAANNLAVLAAIPNEQILGGKRAAVAAATTQLAIASRGLATATAQVTAAQAGATAASNTLAAANSRLAVATGAVAAPLLIKVALLAALVIGFVYAWKESETFRKVMTDVFDAVAKVVGKVLSFVFELFGNLLKGFGELIDVNNTFGKVVASVIQFVYNTYLTWYKFIVSAIKTVIDTFILLMSNQNLLGQIVATVLNFIVSAFAKTVGFVLGAIKNLIDAYVNFFNSNETLRKIVETVFNVIIAVIGFAVTSIVVIFANIIKAIATIIYYFEKLKNFITDVWGKIVLGIDKAKDFIGKILGTLASIMTGVISFMKEKFASFITYLAGLADKIPKVLGGDVIRDALKSIAKSITGVKKAEAGFKPSLGEDISKTALSAISGVAKLNDKIILASKDWGNYKTGAAGALSTVANLMLNFSSKVTKFSEKDNGAKLMEGFLKTAGTTSKTLDTAIKGLKALDEIKFGDKFVSGLIKGAETASTGLGKVVTGLEKMKDLKVGEFIVKNTSQAAMKAGDFLLGLALSIESFTDKGFTEKVGDAIGDMVDKLKTGLGFGDILEELKKELSPPGDIDIDKDAEILAEQANRLKSIRESMKTGIDAIRGVLDDLRQAATDFANSLKDTIVGFAGLKGVELPDGFIPKAKSLIANMEQRLNKSQQFAGQIAQLQAMNLDTDALKSIIEEGPIKGAQLAASILGGGQQAVDEVSRLQKAIQFAGATIGTYGAEAAFRPKIDRAMDTLGAIQYAEMQMKSAGTNVYIEQGAFQLNVDTSGAADADERTGLITKKIEETFAILARQLASK